MSAQPVERGAGSPAPTGRAAGAPVPLARAVVAAVESLVACDVAFAAVWADAERRDVLAALDRAGELVTLYRARVAAAHKADGRWASRGDRSFENHRARTSRTPVGAARAETELGEGLAELPQAASAVQEGRVGLAHAAVLTRLRARASVAVLAALEAGGTEELLALAAEVDVATFAKRVEAWAASRDVTAAEASFEAVRTRRYARAVDREGGVKIDAFVDPVVGAAWRAAIDAHTGVPAVDDERTSDQRAADALASILDRSLSAGAEKAGAQIRPHLSLLVPEVTWARTRRAVGEPATRHRRQGDAILLPELDDGTVVPLSVLDRLACDCEITRMVLDAEGVPLDVGRSQRTYSRELRRAVLVRDGHCLWPGCTVRSAWSEVHHVQPFAIGGATSLDNALTLCAFHHHEVHRRAVIIVTDGAGHAFLRRDGTPIGTSQRSTGVMRLITCPVGPDRGLMESDRRSSDPDLGSHDRGSVDHGSVDRGSAEHRSLDRDRAATGSIGGVTRLPPGRGEGPGDDDALF